MLSLAAMPRSRAPGSGAIHSSTRAWLARKLQLSRAEKKLLSKFWKKIASFSFLL